MIKADYNLIAKYYDTVIGAGFDSSDYLKKCIRKYNKNACSLLELGCGTGENLKTFNRNFDLCGIDISSEMLKIARQKISDCDFYLKDIREFNLNKKFDLTVCLYDTINHITLFSDWKKIFRNTAKHLNENGLFIFDVNTLYKLEYFTSISPVVHKFGSNYLLITVHKISNNTFNWNLKVFEKTGKNLYQLTEANIRESSFEVDKIKKELESDFELLITEDDNGKKIKENSGRVFFICRKK